MAVSQTDVDALERALMSGRLTVRQGDQLVTYRSVAELREALGYAREQLAAASAPGGQSVTQSFASFSRE